MMNFSSFLHTYFLFLSLNIDFLNTAVYCQTENQQPKLIDRLEQEMIECYDDYSKKSKNLETICEEYNNIIAKIEEKKEMIQELDKGKADLNKNLDKPFLQEIDLLKNDLNDLTTNSQPNEELQQNIENRITTYREEMESISMTLEKIKNFNKQDAKLKTELSQLEDKIRKLTKEVDKKKIEKTKSKVRYEESVKMLAEHKQIGDLTVSVKPQSNVVENPQIEEKTNTTQLSNSSKPSDHTNAEKPKKTNKGDKDNEPFYKNPIFIFGGGFILIVAVGLLLYYIVFKKNE